jgi:hypothetical protein
MKRLTMKNDSGHETLVEVDDSVPIDYGGFGTIFALPHEPNSVVKRVDLSPPQPIGNIRGYVAHIRTTKERLLGIKAEEEDQPNPRYWIFDYIDEIVEQALSTHWLFEANGLQIGAVWFLQKKAPGKKLQELFREEPPTGWKRMGIAKDVVTRMRTLRRADLVHLDCVADNIFVDLANEKTTLIDLDGCGVVRRTSGARTQPDEWEHPPSTLGHLKIVRPPPWYPQLGVQSGPKAGNYLFAERWVVVDTIIRILTWNRVSGVLSWVEPDTRKGMVDGYWYIKGVIDTAKKEGIECPYEDWIMLQERILAGLRSQFDRLPPFYGNGAHPTCLDYFANLAQDACLDARVLSSEAGSPYEIYRQKLK